MKNSNKIGKKSGKKGGEWCSLLVMMFGGAMRSLLSPWDSARNPAGVLEFRWTDHGIYTEFKGNSGFLI
jgi:hypothetical protein